MRTLLAAILALALTTPLAAQTGWGILDQLLGAMMITTGTMVASYWLPDNIDPETATAALAVVYEERPDTGNSAFITVAIFARTPDGRFLQRPVEGLYGQTPRDPAFLADRIELIPTAGPVDSIVSCADVVRLNHCPEGRRMRYDDSYHTNGS